MKVALVHDFLTQYGGAERVLDAFLEIFPEAPIFTLVYDQEKMGRFYGKYNIQTSFIQNMLFGVKKYKWYLALMPKAIEAFDFSGYDLVLSDSSAFAKGVVTSKKTTHICFLHTPTRYLWSDSNSYLKTAPIPGIVRPVMPKVIDKLKIWDLKAAKRPDYYIANSENINLRMQKYYHRAADTIIWPPVSTKRFSTAKKIGDYFFLVSRAEPYKKTDMVIEAFNRLGKNYKLIIAGSGTKINEFKSCAEENIKFVGRVSDEELAKLFVNAKALIFPQEEDAGISMLEAMASGRPVIAYRAGGAKEIVIDKKTGEFFDEQTIESIMKVVKQFRESQYDPNLIRQHALKYDKEIFKGKIKKFITSKINK